MIVLKAVHCLPFRSARTGAAFLLCSFALSAQVGGKLQPGQLPLDEPDFPLATPVEAVEGKPAPLTLRGKTDYALKSAFSAETLSRVALTTSIGQLTGVSEDWGPGGAATYGRRLRSRYAGHLVNSGVRYGIGALRGEDPRFYRSGKEGFWARTGFVLSRTVLTQMDDGSTSIAAGKLAGRFAGNTVQNYMRYTPHDPIRNGLTDAGIGLGSDIAFRMAREFWPDIKRAFRK